MRLRSIWTADSQRERESADCLRVQNMNISNSSTGNVRRNQTHFSCMSVLRSCHSAVQTWSSIWTEHGAHTLKQLQNTWMFSLNCTERGHFYSLCLWTAPCTEMSQNRSNNISWKEYNTGRSECDRFSAFTCQNNPVVQCENLLYKTTSKIFTLLSWFFQNECVILELNLEFLWC